MNETLGWKNISLPDERAREEAYAALCCHLRARLERYLRTQHQASHADAEDAVQTALLKLHKAAADRDWANEQAGRAWLYQATRTCYIDILRENKRSTIPLPAPEFDPKSFEVPLIELDFADRVQAAILLGELLHCADAFWLGLDPSLSPASYTRRFLVAQLYFIDGLKPTEISRLVGCPPEDEPELTAARVLDWVRDAGVVRLLAYRTLYLERQNLLACLLRIEEDALSLEALNALWSKACLMPPEEPALGDLSWALVALILMRYRHNTPASAVPLQSPCREWGYSVAQIQEKIAAIKSCLPFRATMAELLEQLDDNQVQSQQMLVQSGLWKRLAFQYWYCQEMPLLDVYERIHPASDQVDYSLNANMLNTWLSGEQLRKQLVKFWWNRSGGEHDE